MISPGIDMVDMERFRGVVDRRGMAFLERLFTPGELAGRPRVESLAGMFAAKEAFLKALGTGLSGGVSWHQVEVERSEGRAPAIRPSGLARDMLRGREASLSISHTGSAAVAVVVIADGGRDR